MNYDELYIQFKEVVPECISFCDKKEKENLIDDTVGIHVSFAMVMVPYLLYIINNNDVGVKSI